MIFALAVLFIKKKHDFPEGIDVLYTAPFEAARFPLLIKQAGVNSGLSHTLPSGCVILIPCMLTSRMCKYMNLIPDTGLTIEQCYPR
ncbi:hypothetical protein EFV16_25850 [Escherichia coli]|nr:hypothetical protein EFV16_25850 [Escherichia coli]